MVLVGVHPSLMQVPPTCSRSTRAVRIPAPASAWHSGVPPCPEPITIASKFFEASEAIASPQQNHLAPAALVYVSKPLADSSHVITFPRCRALRALSTALFLRSCE